MYLLGSRLQQLGSTAAGTMRHGRERFPHLVIQEIYKYDVVAKMTDLISLKFHRA